jgi:DNA polymerase I-like protein with 3'-5' exonuclease and polymerase domains
VQALARIVLSDQMLVIAGHLAVQQRNDPKRTYKVITSTHDEVVCCVPEDYAGECLEMMKQAMATAPVWCADLPLKSSGGYARSYGDCEK